MQLAPPPAGEQQLKIVSQAVERSGGLMAPIKPLDIRALTVTCTHASASIWAAMEGAACTLDTEQFSTNGKLSKDKLIDMSPSMASPFEKGGINWVVVRHEVASRCPSLAGFLAGA
eukprot:6348042-Pyramimonas_sp.AAC.1